MRGFNDEFSNKLLVLVDGRSVYKNVFSGVYWNAQDILLDNVERIEIIRGPGGTIWGANAVNGVINIITKPAEQSRGGRISAGAGGDEDGLVETRYGDRLGSRGAYRMHSKFLQQNPLGVNLRPEPAQDAITASGGVRLDWKHSDREAFLVDGGYFRGSAGTEILDRIRLLPQQGVERYWGAHLLGRWNRRLSGGSSMQAQFYYDGYSRRDLELPFAQQTFDVEFQHQTTRGRHELIWGGEYRYSRNSSGASAWVKLAATPDLQLRSGFFQDQYALRGERLYLITGLRVDSSTFAPVEAQPTVRLLYTPDERTAWWVAVSRAARTPTLTERGVVATVGAVSLGGQLVTATLSGSPEFRSESLVAFEAGHRIQFLGKLAMEVSLYHQRYSGLETVSQRNPRFEPGPPPRIVLPLTYGNDSHGEADGGDLSLRWDAAERWRVSAGYGLVRMKVRTDPGKIDYTAGYAEGRTPRHQALISSHFDVTPRLQLDGFAAYAGALANISQVRIPAYWTGSVRLGWRFTANVDLSMNVDNLGGDHAEFGSPRLPTIYLNVRRNVFGRITWHF
jgi:iron complex outermembrane receptor protein